VKPLTAAAVATPDAATSAPWRRNVLRVLDVLGFIRDCGLHNLSGALFHAGGGVAHGLVVVQFLVCR